MSDAATKPITIGAIFIGVLNLALTAWVNFQVKKAETGLQEQLKKTEARIEQAKAVSTAANTNYLGQIPKLHEATQKYLLFASDVAEGRVKKNIGASTDAHRITLKILAASCESNPSDKKLKAASEAFDVEIDKMAESILENTIDEELHDRVKSLLAAWKNFQREAYRVNVGGYAGDAKT